MFSRGFGYPGSPGCSAGIAARVRSRTLKALLGTLGLEFLLAAAGDPRRAMARKTGMSLQSIDCISAR